MVRSRHIPNEMNFGAIKDPNRQNDKNKVSILRGVGSSFINLISSIQSALTILINRFVTHNHTNGEGAQIDHGGLSGLGDVADHSGYTLTDGTRAFTDVVEGIDPVIPEHLVTKNYVDSVLVNEIQKLTHDGFGDTADSVAHIKYLLLTGGTMSGDIAMGTKKLTGLGAGTVNGDSVSYEQLVGAYLLLTGGTMVGNITMSSNSSLLNGGGSGAVGATGAGNAWDVVYTNALTSDVVDAVNAVGFTLTTTALSTASTKLLSIMNGASEKLYIGFDGDYWSLTGEFRSGVASGGTGFLFNTNNTFSAGYLFQIQENGSEIFSLEHDGDIRTNRGKFMSLVADAGIAFTLDTSVAFTSGSLLKIQNNGTVMWDISPCGRVTIVNGSGCTEADIRGGTSTTRQMLWFQSTLNNGEASDGAFVFDSAGTTLATAGDDLFKIKNNGTTKINVDYVGNVVGSGYFDGAAAFKRSGTDGYIFVPITKYDVSGLVGNTTAGWTAFTSTLNVANVPAAAKAVKIHVEGKCATIDSIFGISGKSDGAQDVVWVQSQVNTNQLRRNDGFVTFVTTAGQLYYYQSALHASRVVYIDGYFI